MLTVETQQLPATSVRVLREANYNTRFTFKLVWYYSRRQFQDLSGVFGTEVRVTRQLFLGFLV